jgi:hypothetical protein
MSQRSFPEERDPAADGQKRTNSKKLPKKLA